MVGLQGLALIRAMKLRRRVGVVSEHHSAMLIHV